MEWYRWCGSQEGDVMGTDSGGREAWPAEVPVVTMSEVRAWSAQGRRRLAERGIYTRDLEKRLQWKRNRGMDTSAEQRFVRYLESVVKAKTYGESED